jgi:hypothetical protein
MLRSTDKGTVGSAVAARLAALGRELGLQIGGLDCQ